jgi:hypothetical protein
MAGVSAAGGGASLNKLAASSAMVVSSVVPRLHIKWWGCDMQGRDRVALRNVKTNRDIPDVPRSRHNSQSGAQKAHQKRG